MACKFRTPVITQIKLSHYFMISEKSTLLYSKQIFDFAIYHIKNTLRYRFFA